MNKKNKLVCGVGINDYEGRVKVNCKMIKSYTAWRNMLKRCYSEKCQIRNPTYTGCVVADEWLYFSNFKQWYDAHYIEGYQIDKDLKNRGNKVYSKENCFFVTPELNSFATHKQSDQGEYPTGVRFDKHRGAYQARISIKGKEKHIGYFDATEEAEKAYLFAKGNEAIRQAMLPTTPDGLRGSLIKWGNRMLIGETV